VSRLGERDKARVDGKVEAGGESRRPSDNFSISITRGHEFVLMERFHFARSYIKNDGFIQGLMYQYGMQRCENNVQIISGQNL